MNKKELINEVALFKADKASKLLVVVTIALMVFALGVSVVLYMSKDNDVTRLSERVVVIDNMGNSKVGTVSKLSEAERSVLVAKNVLRLGVESMYSFSDQNYDEKMKKGVKYFGKSGKVILQGYHNENVKRLVFQNHLRVYVVIDSISVKYVNSELIGNIHFEQSFINGNAVSKRNLIGTCKFINGQLSEDNAFGLLIEDWVVNEVVRENG